MLRVFLILSLAGAVWAQTDPAGSTVDALVLKNLDGADKRLSEYRGKVVVLNFWATWCIPCREEMPLLVSVQKRYAARGVTVVGASADAEDTRSQIAPFIRKLGITFPIWTGATTDHMQALGLGTGLPVTAVVDQEGRLAFRLLGILQRKELEKRIDYLLGGRRAPAPAELVDRISEAAEEEHHSHGGVGVEGASSVPS